MRAKIFSSKYIDGVAIRFISFENTRWRHRFVWCVCKLMYWAILTETGLNSSFFDNNYFCLRRCDRSEANSVHERFGGVLVAVRTDISSERILVPMTDNVELVLVRMKFRNMSVYVCCLYIQSGSNCPVYQRYTEALEKVMEFIDMNAENKFYVLGDFNMSEVSWLPDPGDYDFSSNGFSVSGDTESNVLLPSDVGSNAYADLLYCLMGNVLSQVNDVRNYQGRILDLVFCSEPSEVVVSKSNSPMVKIDNYHIPIDIEFSVGRDDVINFNPEEHEFNFKKERYDELNEYLSGVDWDVIFVLIVLTSTQWLMPFTMF